MRKLAPLFFTAFVLLVACGSNKRGDECTGDGSTDDCGDNLVCGHHDVGGGLECLKRCSDDGDCYSTEQCNSVTTTSTIKACIGR